MRLLLDSCVWGGAAASLRDAGHDVESAADWPQDPGDEAILARANDERRVIVTLDKDFGTLAVLNALPHRGIIRLVGIAARRQAAATEQALSRYADDLNAGSIVTVEADRVRVRRPAGGETR